MHDAKSDDTKQPFLMGSKGTSRLTPWQRVVESCVSPSTWSAAGVFGTHAGDAIPAIDVEFGAKFSYSPMTWRQMHMPRSGPSVETEVARHNVQIDAGILPASSIDDTLKSVRPAPMCDASMTPLAWRQAHHPDSCHLIAVEELPGGNLPSFDLDMHSPQISASIDLTPKNVDEADFAETSSTPFGWRQMHGSSAGLAEMSTSPFGWRQMHGNANISE